MGRRHVDVDHVGPGVQHVVDADHRRDRARGGSALPVASMPDSGPGDAPADTVLAHLPIAEECPHGAQKPVVPQCLNHGGAPRPRGGVNRGRDQREEILNMQDVEVAEPVRLADIAVRLPRPDTASRRSYPAKLLDSEVVFFVPLDLPTMRFQQVALGLVRLILATALQVSIVHHQYSQWSLSDGARDPGKCTIEWQACPGSRRSVDRKSAGSATVMHAGTPERRVIGPVRVWRSVP